MGTLVIQHYSFIRYVNAAHVLPSLSPCPIFSILYILFQVSSFFFQFLENLNRYFCCKRLSLTKLQPNTKTSRAKKKKKKKKKKKMNEKLKMLFDVYGSHIAQPDLAI